MKHTKSHATGNGYPTNHDEFFNRREIGNGLGLGYLAALGLLNASLKPNHNTFRDSVAEFSIQLPLGKHRR